MAIHIIDFGQENWWICCLKHEVKRAIWKDTMLASICWMQQPEFALYLKQLTIYKRACVQVASPRSLYLYIRTWAKTLNCVLRDYSMRNTKESLKYWTLTCDLLKHNISWKTKPVNIIPTTSTANITLITLLIQWSWISSYRNNCFHPIYAIYTYAFNYWQVWHT